MLNNQYFYFSTSRKYISIFGSLFNNLYINRTANGSITQVINVPVSWGQKEKMMTRMIQDPNITKESSIILPRMSFYLDGLEYDDKRKTNSLNKITMDAGNNIQYQYSGVPYNYKFSLYIYVKNAEDGTKIIEQILPFFKPEFTVRAFMVEGQPSQDISINLEMIEHEYNDTENFKDFPVLIWTLRFTLKGILFGPTNISPKIGDVKTEICFGEVTSNATINIHSFGLHHNLYSNSTAYTNSYSIDFKANTTSNGTIIEDWDQIITTIG